MKKWFRHISFSRIQFFSVLLLMFFLPFNRVAISDFTALWVLTWLVERITKRNTYRYHLPPLLRYSFYGGILFYLLFVIGMLFTQNIDDGLFDLQVKLGLILFPLMLFYSNRYYHRFFHLILMAFLLGAITITSIYWGHLFFVKYSQGIFPLYYSQFVLLMHTSYYAMYLSFATLIAFYLYEQKKIRLFFLFIITGLFIASIYLTSAKSGFISIIAVFIIYFIYHIRRHASSRWIFIVLFLLLIPTSFYYMSSNVRFNAGLNEFLHDREQTPDPHTVSSSSLRILIWEVSNNLIIENPFGYGTGDVKDILVNQYHEQDITKAEALKLNVHNQFLETTIAIGILGSLLFVMILLLPIIYFTKTKNWLLPIGFIFIIIINFSTESMLNRQAGVIFFAFFYNLILLNFPRTQSIKEEF